MPLSPDEIDRYARHIVLRDIGGPGQQKLKAARVLVIGAGGLGSPVIQYLAAAGVGTIGIVDDDDVSLSNLQRQVIHGTADLGRPKVDSAADAVRRLNPHVAAVPHPVRVLPRTPAACRRVRSRGRRLGQFRDPLRRLRRVLSCGKAAGHGGARPVRRHADDDPRASNRAGRRPNPTYRCLFPSPPPPGTIPSCAEAGVLGALAGVLGSLMAMEAIREIVGFGESLVGRLLMIDARAMRFETIRYAWDENNPLSGRGGPSSRPVRGSAGTTFKPSRGGPRRSSLPPRRRSSP